MGKCENLTNTIVISPHEVFGISNLWDAFGNPHFVGSKSLCLARQIGGKEGGDVTNKKRKFSLWKMVENGAPVNRKTGVP